MKKTFEEFLQDKFIALGEIGGIPIIKDNAEDLFEGWLENRDVSEMMDYAEEAIQKARLEVMEEVVAKLEPQVEALKNLTK